MLESLRYQQYFYHLLDQKYGHEKANAILSIHGLSNGRLDPYNYTKHLINSHYIADVSVDPNANVGNEKLATKLMIEPMKPWSKLVGFIFLYEQMKESYGRERADELMVKLLDGSLYLHDPTRVLNPYCSAFSTRILLEQGRRYGRLWSKPPKKPRSFIGQVIETVMNLSQEQSGALALIDIFPCYAISLIYYYANENNLDFNQAADKLTRVIKNNQKIRKMVEDDFQSMVHVFHNNFRINSDPPFTNVTIGDEPLLQGMMQEAGYWAFIENKYGAQITTKFKRDFIDLVKEIQLIYAEFMSKGDPVSGAFYTFPVTTLNVTIGDDGEIIDQKYIKKLLAYNTKGIFNIYHSYGLDSTKFNSCCRLVLDYTLQRGIDSFGAGVFTPIGSLRVVSINIPRLGILANRYASSADNDLLKVSLLLLKQSVKDARDVLYAHRKLLERLIEAGYLLPFQLGWYNFKTFFSTFGFIGIAEMVANISPLAVEDEEQYVAHVENILDVFNKEVSRFIAEDKVPYNIEQVPGESLAATFVKLDNIVFDFNNNTKEEV